jgi:hypothetical protein
MAGKKGEIRSKDWLAMHTKDMHPKDSKIKTVENRSIQC